MPSTPAPAPSVTIECTTCHNPHGNGNYRILNPAPDPAGLTATTGQAIVLDDSANANVVRNYTIIQAKSGTTNDPSRPSRRPPTPTSRATTSTVRCRGIRRSPTPAPPASGVTINDAPNGLSSSFGPQIAAWCITCHSRYASEGWAVNTGDNIFKYRHTSQSTSRNCVTCHVSHGSNATMNGWNSTHAAYPNADGSGGTYAPFSATASTDSRLLKIDNRGTCQACHDPTGTVGAGAVRPTNAPAPVPYAP